MKRPTRLFIYVDPDQPAGSYGQKVKMEIQRWTEEGWRVKILLPEHIRKGNRRFPKTGWLLINKPCGITREQCTLLCSPTRK